MPKKEKIPREHQTVLCLIDELLEYSQEHGRAITGQIVIEREEGNIIMFFGMWPNGSYLTWFIDQGNFILYSLVNEQKHCLTCPVADVHILQAKINELKPLLGK